MRVVSKHCALPFLMMLGVACGGDDPVPDTDTVDTDIEVTPDTDTVDTTPPEDVEDTQSETDVGPTCEPFELTGVLIANDVSGVYTLGGEIVLGFGSPDTPDTVIFELFSDAAGTFTLGTGVNENYETCDQCIRIVEDTGAGAGKTRQYFPTAGSITIENTGGRSVRVTLTDLVLVEVTIRTADLRSIPVENGKCYRSAASITLETAACTPSCGDHVCGDDGCGGECGAGCDGTTVCSLDGQQCETSANVCQRVEVSGVLTNPAAGVYRLVVTELGLGAVDARDFLQIEFYTNSAGGFSLGGGVNRNYRTCEQCVRLVVDGRREFFQREGLLTVSELSVPIAEPGVDAFVDLTFNGVILDEVTLDDEFNSTKKTGGTCVDLVVDGALRSSEL